MASTSHAITAEYHGLRLHQDCGGYPDTGGDTDVPLPLTVIVGIVAAGDGTPPVYAVDRSWREADARRCALCPVCEAVYFGNGFAACKVAAMGEIDPAAAALYRREVPT